MREEKVTFVTTKDPTLRVEKQYKKRKKTTTTTTTTTPITTQKRQ